MELRVSVWYTSNQYTGIRELLLDRVIVEHVFIWMLTSILYATLAAYYAARQFKREDIVTTLSENSISASLTISIIKSIS